MMVVSTSSIRTTTWSSQARFMGKIQCPGSSAVRGTWPASGSSASLSSIHAITARLNPIKIPNVTPTGANAAPSRPEPSSGLEVMETENFRLQCFNTMTGTKFLVFTDTTQANVDVTLRRIYDLYADYVMKNPFYQLEMPVRCDIFDRKLLSYIREINNR
jgi:trafficking protein particle complex subunit 4